MTESYAEQIMSLPRDRCMSRAVVVAEVPAFAGS
jgi:hypothetical protein